MNEKTGIPKVIDLFAVILLILSVIAGIGFSLEFDNPIFLVVGILSGLLNYALFKGFSKCVEACELYIDSKKDKASTPKNMLSDDMIDSSTKEETDILNLKDELEKML